MKSLREIEGFFVFGKNHTTLIQPGGVISNLSGESYYSWSSTRQKTEARAGRLQEYDD